jgi:CDP-glucose 4,6-dehydratase
VIGGGDWAPHRIVPDFFRSIEAHQPMVLRNPHATRPWQFVLEPLSGYLLVAARLFLEGKKYSGGWNFGPGMTSEFTVRELIQAIQRCYGSGSVQIEPRAEQLHEASLLRLDISKAITMLHWKPVLPFDELIQFTVDGYRDDLQGIPLYHQRINQLSHYVQLAQEQNVVWTNNGESVRATCESKRR